MTDAEYIRRVNRNAKARGLSSGNIISDARAGVWLEAWHKNPRLTPEYQVQKEIDYRNEIYYDP